MAEKDSTLLISDAKPSIEAALQGKPKRYKFSFGICVLSLAGKFA